MEPGRPELFIEKKHTGRGTGPSQAGKTVHQAQEERCRQRQSQGLRKAHANIDQEKLHASLPPSFFVGPRPERPSRSARRAKKRTARIRGL